MPGQRWKLVRYPENQSTYINLVPNSSRQGLVADITNANINNGMNVQLWSANASQAQQWAIRKLNFNYVKPSRPGTPTGIQYFGINGSTKLSWNAVRSSSFLDCREYEVIVDGISRMVKDTSLTLALSEGNHSVKIRAVNTAYLNWASEYAVTTVTVVKPQYHDFSKDIITGTIPEPK